MRRGLKDLAPDMDIEAVIGLMERGGCSPCIASGRECDALVCLWGVWKGRACTGCNRNRKGVCEAKGDVVPELTRAEYNEYIDSLPPIDWEGAPDGFKRNGILGQFYLPCERQTEDGRIRNSRGMVVWPGTRKMKVDSPEPTPPPRSLRRAEGSVTPTTRRSLEFEMDRLKAALSLLMEHQEDQGRLASSVSQRLRGLLAPAVPSSKRGRSPTDDEDPQGGSDGGRSYSVKDGKRPV